MNFRAGPASAGRGVVTAAGGNGRSLHSPSDRPARNSTPSPLQRAQVRFAIARVTVTSSAVNGHPESPPRVSRLSILSKVEALGSEIECSVTDGQLEVVRFGRSERSSTRYRANRSKPRTRLLDNDATTARRAFPTIERSLAGLFWVCVKEPRLTFYKV